MSDPSEESVTQAVSPQALREFREEVKRLYGQARHEQNTAFTALGSMVHWMKLEVASGQVAVLEKLLEKLPTPPVEP